MPWGYALVAGATVYSGHEAGSAADAQIAGANRAAGLSQRQYEQTRNDLTPYRVLGDQAAGIISRVFGLGGDDPDFSEFFNSPDYNFRLESGVKAQDMSAARQGLLLSGQQEKAVNEFGQNLASTEFNNWFSRLNSLMQGGQNAAVQTGNFGANAANVTGGYYNAAGQYDANGIYNRTNAITGGLQDIAGFLGDRYKTPTTQPPPNSNAFVGDVNIPPSTVAFS